LDDSTGGELLLGEMIAQLQNAWGASREEYEDLETLAKWAIQKESKLATVKHIQGSPHDKKCPTRKNQITKPGWDIPTLK